MAAKNKTAATKCIYAKKLADLEIPTLEKLCKATIGYIHEQYVSTGAEINENQ